MKSLKFKESNLTLTSPENGPECNDLHVQSDGMGMVSIWELTQEEINAVVLTGRLKLTVLADVHPPVAIESSLSLSAFSVDCCVNIIVVDSEDMTANAKLGQHPNIKPDGSIEFIGETYKLLSWNEVRSHIENIGDPDEVGSPEEWESEHFTIEVSDDGVSVNVHSKAAASWDPDRMTWKTFEFPNSDQANNFADKVRVLLRSIFEFARVAEFPNDAAETTTPKRPEDERGWVPK